MRLLAWNIRQGGGARLAAIAAALARHDADVLVLSEYRGGEAALRLREMLAALGYRHATAAMPPPGRNGVLIASRRRFRTHAVLCETVPEPYKMVAVEFARLRLCGIYMPNLKAKVPYWEALIAALAAAEGNVLAIGDFNTCRPYLDEAGMFDKTGYFMDRIAAIGFRDLWRERHPDGREYPGTAAAATASASTTPFCRRTWRGAPGRSPTRTKSVWPGSATTRRCCWN